MLIVALGARNGLAVSWFPFGPDGGDARAFAVDPHDSHHIYLGTAIGWIYESRDGGHTWARLARIAGRDDLVLDNIVIDPTNSRHIVVGTWVLGQTDGGLYVSRDAGANWVANAEMKGQSIRALSLAPSDPRTIVAGTLKGVFRSSDGGDHWLLISPSGSQELHEVESIAIDPSNPLTIYAGTWHLPWKTTDGGQHWNNIKQGIIDDSDVFSIIIDPKSPDVVYASACSGIYKSEDGGAEFKKIQGIPSTARRTRVLMQDPQHLGTVFAGTTQGLFRTDDAGSYWTRTTSDDVIVNDVYIDPTDSRRVLMATDRGGVLASDDGGTSFSSSNRGFSSRQVVALLPDAHHPSEIYLGVVNDKEWGGAFFSRDGGLRWTQIEQGLDGRDIFTLAQAADGTVLAGTERGIFAYNAQQQIWSQVGKTGTASPAKSGPPGRPATPEAAKARAAVRDERSIEGSVFAIAPVGERMFAATASGVYETDRAAGRWQAVEGLSGEPWRFIAGGRGVVMLASLRSITVSVDDGHHWRLMPLPGSLTQIGAIAVDGGGSFWVGGREGLFVSTDNGMSWKTIDQLFVSDVNSLFYDAVGERLLVTANGAAAPALSIHLPDHRVQYWATGWSMRSLRPVGNYLIGATFFDGIVVQPRMVQSPDRRGQ